MAWKDQVSRNDLGSVCFNTGGCISGACKLFDEMSASDFRSPSRVLEVTIHQAYYPITEKVLRLVFDPFGEVQHVHVFGRSDPVLAIVVFQSKHQAADAFGELHGRYLYAGCCQLDIKWGLLQECEATREKSRPNTITSSSSNLLEASMMTSTGDKELVTDTSLFVAAATTADVLGTSDIKFSVQGLDVDTGVNDATSMFPPVETLFEELTFEKPRIIGIDSVATQSVSSTSTGPAVAPATWLHAWSAVPTWLPTPVAWGVEEEIPANLITKCSTECLSRGIDILKSIDTITTIWTVPQTSFCFTDSIPLVITKDCSLKHLQERYITTMTPSLSNGIVLLCVAICGHKYGKVLESMTSQSTIMFAPVLAHVFDKEKWPPPLMDHNALVVVHYRPPWPPPTQLDMQRTEVQLRPIPWSSFTSQIVVVQWNKLLPMMFCDSMTKCVRKSHNCEFSLQCQRQWPEFLENTFQEDGFIRELAVHMFQYLSEKGAFSLLQSQIQGDFIWMGILEMYWTLISNCHKSVQWKLSQMFLMCFYTSSCRFVSSTSSWHNGMVGFLQWSFGNALFDSYDCNKDRKYFIWIQWDFPWFLSLLMCWPLHASSAIPWYVVFDKDNYPNVTTSKECFVQMLHMQCTVPIYFLENISWNSGDLHKLGAKIILIYDTCPFDTGKIILLILDAIVCEKLHLHWVVVGLPEGSYLKLIFHYLGNEVLWPLPLLMPQQEFHKVQHEWSGTLSVTLTFADIHSASCANDNCNQAEVVYKQMGDPSILLQHEWLIVICCLTFRYAVLPEEKQVQLVGDNTIEAFVSCQSEAFKLNSSVIVIYLKLKTSARRSKRHDESSFTSVPFTAFERVFCLQTWDPGGINSSAWGQADFQEEGNVRSLCRIGLPHGPWAIASLGWSDHSTRRSSKQAKGIIDEIFRNAVTGFSSLPVPLPSLYCSSSFSRFCYSLMYL